MDGVFASRESRYVKNIPTFLLPVFVQLDSSDVVLVNKNSKPCRRDTSQWTLSSCCLNRSGNALLDNLAQ